MQVINSRHETERALEWRNAACEEVRASYSKLLQLAKVGVPLSYEVSNQQPQLATFNLIHCLRALYAQSFRITLAPPVLPRLLARS